MKNQIFILLVGVIFLYCNSKNEVTESTSKPQTTPKTLKETLPFPLGASLSPTKLFSIAAYRKTVDAEFSSVTAENMMKMHIIHPETNRYNWLRADTIVNVAKQNKQRVHGHAFVWHESTPNWVKGFQGDAAAWDSLIKSHIQTILSYYKGKIGSWDVVNEAFNDDGTWRNSVYREKLGDDYVAKCFKWAREADPSVLLFYNDFGQESSEKKLQATLDMVADFKKRGIPIDGIGLQMHTHIGISDARITNAIQKSVETGLKIHISELDVAVNQNNTANFIYTDALKNQQSDKFLHIFKTYRQIPQAQQFGITFWNVCDSDSWLRSYFKRPLEYPLLFDDNYDRKPVYDKLVAEMQK
ncbi:MAG: endo-1,4-beta-xylanase [Saprospiraceae bacterium]|nr:endo-1,4-beta-xylanase [Saprospiraceae bacterium]